MSKQHKPMQTQGRQAPSAAKIATDTSSTYGAVSPPSSSSTSAVLGDKGSYETTAAPPVSSSDKGNTPITFGHLQIGWKVLTVFATIIVFIAGIAWSMSKMSSKVDQHEDAIKEGNSKTEKLLSDSAATSVKLQKLDSEVGKLEDKMFELSRPKK